MSSKSLVRIFATLMISLAVTLAILGTTLAPDYLHNIITIINFFNIILPIAMFSALVLVISFVIRKW